MTKIDLSNQQISIVGDLAFVSNHMSADVAPGGKPGHVELNIYYFWKKVAIHGNYSQEKHLKVNFFNSISLIDIQT